MSETLDDRVLSVLREADEPLSAGAIQRRVAREGFDATTGAVREACERLAAAGDVERADGTTYRIADG